MSYSAILLRTQLSKKTIIPFVSLTRRTILPFTTFVSLTRRTILPFTTSSSSSTKCRSQFHHFTPPSPPPPTAKKVPFTVSAHGVTWQDPYHWMSNTNDPDFISYLHQENAYADAFTKDTRELQRLLFDEMVSRLPSKISTPPERWGPWLYYQCIPDEKEYPVLCRKLASEGKGWMNNLVKYVRGLGREEILLDWNEIAEQHGYVHVGTCRISPDHNFLAYTIDVTGSEQFILQIKDLRNNCVLPRFRVEGVVSLAWAQDGCTLFYTLSDKNQRPYRLQCIKLGSDSLDDTPLFLENDSSFCVDITSTKDGKFITVNSNSRTSSKVYVIDATNLGAGLQRFCKRVSGVQYFLEHHQGFFYVLTNAPMKENLGFPGKEGYYLARCKVEDMQPTNLQYIIAPREGICLQDMDMFRDHLVLSLSKDGSASMCSINMPIDVSLEKQVEIEDLNPWFFPLPSNVHMITPGSNHDFTNSVYRVVLSSPVMPDVIVDYDMSRKASSIVQQEEVSDINSIGASSLNHKKDTNKHHAIPIQEEIGDESNIIHRWRSYSEAYCCERKEVISRDGSSVPLTILYSRKSHQKGQSPGILHVYGAYGEVLDKNWSADRLSLLDRGWVIAFADVRGGSGADPSWHRSGSGLCKLNSVYDFLSCGEHLVNEGYVNARKLCAFSISAGSLLVGAAINMHPHLFQAAILKVPFLDICNTLLDPNLPLTLLDYEEFGNPQIQSEFEYIQKYAPYDNILQGACCPAMLVTASFNDSRVGVWEAAKWVAKIRDFACSSCSHSVILQTNMTGGHFSEGGRYGQCHETAYEYAFLMKVMETFDREMRKDK